ncbi:sialidase family protein [Cohnella phaseoli]|uniref:BNR repeat protein n=1 Tax=Cohnella phaseoli TaxID=456490 RepID=A0A3D9HV61_9BACL|nr:sialidase family protein [Cohnella phaseoli]RED52776.1 BNR repeat protein [Cohnella phaseoli]
MNKLGDIVLELGPSEGNPRNSEGAFIELKDGRLLLVYSRFLGDSPEDYAYAVIAKRYSADRGNTWTDDEVIARPEEYDAINLMSVSLLRLGNGDIGMFYGVRQGWHDLRFFLRRSADEGESWSEAVCCMPGPGYFNVNNDRVIRLQGGRLVIPASYFRMRGESTVDLSSWDPRAMLFFYLSDDDGVTWRESSSFYTLPYSRSGSGLDEPGVIELADGTLWAWCRTDMGYQYETFSMDRGETWSVPVPSIFTSPNSPLSMKRIPGSNDLLAVWNPIPDYQTRVYERHTAGRFPLIGAISKDEGKTWGHFFSAETDESSGYCYVSIHFVDDSVLLAYCAGNRQERSCLRRLRVSRIKISDILSQP